MNPIRRLVERFGNTGAVSNAAAELEVRRAENAVIADLADRITARTGTRTSDAA